MKRGAGILMPIFSLPGKERFGTLGDCAYKFVDFLHESGHIYWQVLPINEPDIYGSPFCSTCINSGNPLFIDVSKMLTSDDLKSIDNKKRNMTPSEYKAEKMELLYKVYKSNYNEDEINLFLKQNQWVIDYAKYSSIQKEYLFLKDFPKALKDKESVECEEYFESHKDEINFYIYCQYLFFKQDLIRLFNLFQTRIYLRYIKLLRDFHLLNS